jgi:hypothetical protein
MIGGCVTTRKWADEIGADGYGEDAIEAVRVARTLMGSHIAHNKNVLFSPISLELDF